MKTPYKRLIFITFKVIFIISLLTKEVSSKNEGLNVEFKYKKYEKFDFEDLVIEGEVTSPNELSLYPRYEKI